MDCQDFRSLLDDAIRVILGLDSLGRSPYRPEVYAALDAFLANPEIERRVGLIRERAAAR